MTNMHEGTPSLRTWQSALEVAHLAGVVYSAGKVFENLAVGPTTTENFLRSGSGDGITSRADLALLQDLRDVAQFIIDHRTTPIDSAYVCDVNAQITRSGPLRPGRFRSADQKIGVSTPHGRHEPKPIDEAGLQRLVDEALAHAEPREQALELFVQIAKAQPFEDGNKRTALFVANSVLIRAAQPETLVIPVDDEGADLASSFNDQLARAYIFDEHEGVKSLLRARGFRGLGPASQPGKAPHLERNPELLDVKLDPHGLADAAPVSDEGPELGWRRSDAGLARSAPTPCEGSQV